MLALRLPICAEIQDALFGNLPRGYSRVGQVASRVCSQPARLRTRSVGVEGRTRKAHLRGDDVGVGEDTRSHVGITSLQPRGKSRRLDLEPVIQYRAILNTVCVPVDSGVLMRLHH
jgi:hypothetical protein